MRQAGTVLGLILLLIMPVYASAQNPERISIIDNFGSFDRGESLFIFGRVASIQNDSFLIMQIINPEGDLCQIQQLTPLPNGEFMTDGIPLSGRICGLVGEYEVKLFYGDYSTTANFQVTNKIFFESTPETLIASAKNLLSKTLFVLGEKNNLEESFINNVNDVLLSDDLPTIEKHMLIYWMNFILMNSVMR